MTTPERLEEQLEQLDMSNAELARTVGVAISSVQRWIKGKTPIPLMLTRFLDLLISARQAKTTLVVSWTDPAGVVDGQADLEVRT